jgi:hypothetical protein
VAAQTKVCSDDDPVCAAGDRCGMKGTKLTNKEHHCQNCSKSIHGALCGTLWAERGQECRRTDLLDMYGRLTTSASSKLFYLFIPS